MNPAKECLYTREIRELFKVGIFFLSMKKFENVTFIGEGAYSEPLTLKSRSATYIFYYFVGSS